jgi:hypothetical protein
VAQGAVVAHLGAVVAYLGTVVAYLGTVVAHGSSGGSLGAVVAH